MWVKINLKECQLDVENNEFNFLHIPQLNKNVRFIGNGAAKKSFEQMWRFVDKTSPFPFFFEFYFFAWVNQKKLEEFFISVCQTRESFWK